MTSASAYEQCTQAQVAGYLSPLGGVLAAATLLVPIREACAAPPRSVEITNTQLRAWVCLPDASTGFYRGTRFDWSGVIVDLEFAGHNYFPPWFQRTDPNVRDFTYEGADIIASPCTAITGPAEEFTSNGQPLGFSEAKPGGTFIKIGVGVLRRPDERPYDAYRLYEVADGGNWTINRTAASVQFRQELSDASTGYGYDYTKTVELDASKAVLVLDHRLRNTGKRAIQTSVYDHNFFYLDRQPPSPEVRIVLPFKARTAQPLGDSPAEIRDNEIGFTKTLTGQDRAYMTILGYGADPRDYDFRLENRKLGAGVRITGDRPLARLALWCIRAPLSLEPFVDMTIASGGEFTWSIRYEFYTVPKGAAEK
jgi:hypothetical protein